MKKIFQNWGSSIGPKTRWLTIIVWVLLVGVVSMVWPQVNSQETKSNQLLPDDSMSVESSKIADEQFSDDAGVPLLLAWYSADGLSEEDYTKIQKLYGELEDQPLDHQKTVPPFAQMPPQALEEAASEDGKALTTPVIFNESASTEELQQSLDDLQERVETIIGDRVLQADLSEQGLHLRLTGPVGIQTDATSLFSSADVTLLIATVLLVLILLIILYRSPLLAIVPLIAVGVAYGLISPLLGFMAKQNWIEVDAQAISIMTVLLFGAGTDYCLFLISRYREELRLEANKYTALHKAVTGTGGAIMISALTTVTGLLTLALAYYGSYDRFAVPFSLSIFIMGIAALTLLPAILAILGRFAFIPFIPRTEEMIQKVEKKKGKKLRRPQSSGPFGRALGRWSTEKPWLIIISCVIVLGGLAAFVPQAKYTYGLLESFPEDMPSREGFEIIADHYPPGEIAPVQVIVDSEGEDLSLKEELTNMKWIETVSEPAIGSKDESYQQYEITLAIDPYSNQAIDYVPTLKNNIEKYLQGEGIAASNNVWIGGETATLYDTEEVTSRDQSVIIPAVLIIIALLLLVYLRSVVAMVYLLATVLLSYLAALGLGWIIIHYGLGASAMQGLIPVYSFVFLVALGEDYNIFMASSIWKKRKHKPLKQAISEGVSETSGVIGSAGLILAGTFAVLAILPLQVLVHFGTVTAIGVLLDTFVVRPLLVPALTTVLGRYAFWPGKLWKKKDDDMKEVSN